LGRIAKIELLPKLATSEGEVAMLWKSLAVIIVFCSVCASGAQAEEASLLRKAIEHYQFQDFEKASQALGEVLKAEPGNITAHYYLGLTLQQTGKAKEALPHLEIAARSGNPPEGIEDVLASTYIAAGQSEKAVPYYRKRHQAFPNNEAVTFKYASALQAAGNEDESSTLFRSLITRNGQYADPARYQLGVTLTNLGAYTTAVEQFKAVNPKSPYGNAAKAYIDALAHSVKPFNVYLSAEYFYNDNPSTSGSSITATKATGNGSLGTTFIGQISTRAMQISDRLQAKLVYLYYGTFYTKDFAKDNNFVGHFINPSLTYHLSAKDTIKLKGDIQFYYFNQQHLSNNFGATLTGTHNIEGGHSIKLHAAYIDKAYNGNYNSSGTITSLKYLDARNWSAGIGGTAVASPDWPASLTVDYNFSDERTKSQTGATLNAKALDSRYREHAASVDLTLPSPFKGVLSRLSLIWNMDYSQKNYPNAQSGNVYTDVKNQTIKARSLTWGGKLKFMIWKKISLNAVLGYEQNKSHSHTSTLTYDTNRYYGQLSAYY